MLMKTMTKEDLTRFTELLDSYYNWPTHYEFKWIVPAHQKMEVLIHFEGIEKIVIKEKLSGKGNYLSLSVTLYLNSSTEVLDIYKKLKSVKGIIQI